MNLHTDKRLFTDAVLATAQYLGINPIFVEKDYWISRALKLMAEGDKEGRAIFKGGTSLSKAHFIGSRFSEDIDIAIADADSMNGNQRKTLIRRLAKSATAGLDEIPTSGITSKGSNYYRAIYGYPKVTELSEPSEASVIRTGQIMLEINSFANPFPFVKSKIGNFINEFLRETGNEGIIQEFGLGDFSMNVLDKRRTATEKILSLLRFSLARNHNQELAKKIRHFYDLYYLSIDSDCSSYFQSIEFAEDLKNLLLHDWKSFDKPEGWNQRTVLESPLFNSLHEIWVTDLSATYKKELTALAYKDIPPEQNVIANMMDLMKVVKTIVKDIHLP